MRFEFLRVKPDADRQALHHLDPVAGGVLRRDGRKSCPRACGKAFHHALITNRTAIKIGIKLDLLADPHLAQLDFLEVGVDVHFLHRHHGQQRHSRLHTLPQLHLSLGDDAINRRADHRALQIDGSLIAASASKGDFRIRLLVRPGNQHRIGLARAQGGRAIGLGLRSSGSRRRKIRLGTGKGIFGAGQLLAGNRTGRRERLAAREVDFRAGEISFSRSKLRGGPLLISLTRGNLRGQAAVVGNKALDAARCPSQIRLGLRQREPGVGLIDPDQHITLLHRLRISHQHLADRPANRRCHLSDFNGGIRIIGGYEVRSMKIPVAARPRRKQDDQPAQSEQLPLALGFAERRVLYGFRHDKILVSFSAQRRNALC